MLDTEKVANTKSCWRASTEDRFVACAASSCMAWRWFDSVSDDGTKTHHKPTVMTPRVPEPDTGRDLSERRGFCGIAGGYQK